VDWTTTDLVNARSLLEKNPRALKMVATCPAEKRLAVQLFGAVPEEMRDAAAMVESMGIASVDINMGCPVKKVTGIGGGSAMMTELDKTAKLVRGMIDAVKIPITAKMRLGWDDDNLTAPDLARVLEDTGVAAIFVHGRTRAQGFPAPSTSPASAPSCRPSAASPSSATATSRRPKPRVTCSTRLVAPA
jgi:tRNA-dihydrouridine synthase B